MSGWDNAPEYGGSGHWVTNLLAALAIVAMFALCWWPRDASADPCTAALPTGAGTEFSGVVQYVGDGDSICVGPAGTPGSGWIEVRLMDFDAPELHDVGGAEAKQILSHLVFGVEAECIVTRGRSGTRSWDRTHAICRVGGRTIGDLMREARAPQGGN